jgi:hypothetical protein
MSDQPALTKDEREKFAKAISDFSVGLAARFQDTVREVISHSAASSVDAKVTTTVGSTDGRPTVKYGTVTVNQAGGESVIESAMEDHRLHPIPTEGEAYLYLASVKGFDALLPLLTKGVYFAGKTTSLTVVFHLLKHKPTAADTDRAEKDLDGLMSEWWPKLDALSAEQKATFVALALDLVGKDPDSKVRSLEDAVEDEHDHLQNSYAGNMMALAKRQALLAKAERLLAAKKQAESEGKKWVPPTWKEVAE